MVCSFLEIQYVYYISSYLDFLNILNIKFVSHGIPYLEGLLVVHNVSQPVVQVQEKGQSNMKRHFD